MLWKVATILAAIKICGAFTHSVSKGSDISSDVQGIGSGLNPENPLDRHKREKSRAQERIFKHFDPFYLDPFALDDTYDGKDQKVFKMPSQPHYRPQPYHNGHHWVQPRPPNVLDATYDTEYLFIEDHIPHSLPEGYSLEGYLSQHRRHARRSDVGERRYSAQDRSRTPNVLDATIHGHETLVQEPRHPVPQKAPNQAWIQNYQQQLRMNQVLQQLRSFHQFRRQQQELQQAQRLQAQSSVGKSRVQRESQESQCEDRHAQLVGDIFMGNEIVPQIFDNPPDHLLDLTFRTVRTYPGMKLSAGVTRFNPTIRWDAETNAYYTIVLSNLDINSRKNRSLSEFWHWFVGNIPEGDIDSGDVIFDLLHPLVLSEGNGDHRFGYFVFKQTGKMDFSEEGGPTDSCSPSMSAGRGPNRSSREFMKKYDMKLTSATFIIIDHDQASDQLACEWQKCMKGHLFAKESDCDVSKPKKFRKKATKLKRKNKPFWNSPFWNI